RREHSTYVFPRGGPGSGDHFVKHRAKTKDIASSVEGFSANLLWRHIRRGSNYHSRQGRQALSLVLGVPNLTPYSFGQSKIEYFDLLPQVDHHILRFDISMDDALG